MAICPFAEWRPITGPSGPYTGGSFRIIHHTTEGSTAQGAFDAFAKNHDDPHFTVDESTVYQHIDTEQWSRALRHTAGQPETNKWHAVQIEVVGFAAKPKSHPLLDNVGRLCRWIEQTHGVPLTWPNGYPKPAVDGHDPGGHNRDMATWIAQGGHYGHCHVPENVHWDPGYQKAEVEYLMAVQPAAEPSPAAPAKAGSKTKPAVKAK